MSGTINPRLLRSRNYGYFFDETTYVDVLKMTLNARRWFHPFMPARNRWRWEFARIEDNGDRTVLASGAAGTPDEAWNQGQSAVRLWLISLRSGA